MRSHMRATYVRETTEARVLKLRKKIDIYFKNNIPYAYWSNVPKDLFQFGFKLDREKKKKKNKKTNWEWKKAS